MPNCSLNWPAGRARHFELATSAAASYFSRSAVSRMRSIQSSSLLLFIVGFVLSAMCSNAVAESWSHPENIRAAIKRFNQLYLETGISGVSSFLTGCYAEAKKSGRGSKIESCIAIDYAAAWIDEGFAKQWQKQHIGGPLSDLQYPYFLPDAQRKRIVDSFAGESLSSEKRDDVLRKIQSAAIEEVVHQLRSDDNEGSPRDSATK